MFDLRRKFKNSISSIAQTRMIVDSVEEEEMSTKFMTLGHILSEIIEHARNGIITLRVQQYYKNLSQPIPTPQAILDEALKCNYELFRAAGDKKQIEAVQNQFPNFFT